MTNFKPGDAVAALFGPGRPEVPGIVTVVGIPGLKEGAVIHPPSMCRIATTKSDSVWCFLAEVTSLRPLSPGEAVAMTDRFLKARKADLRKRLKELLAEHGRLTDALGAIKYAEPDDIADLMPEIVAAL